MKTLIYTKQDCSYCLKAKAALKAKEIAYYEIEVGSDISRADFIQLYPNVKTLPYIIVDNKPLGGYTDLQTAIKTKVIQ